MGQTNKILLLISLIGLLGDAATAASEPSGFWVWSGMPMPDVGVGKTIYLFQGQIRESPSNRRFDFQGIAPHKPKFDELYLVFRLSVLDTSSAFQNLLLVAIRTWEKKGVAIKGIQLDFDSPSKKLFEYENYLRMVRGWIPKNYQLSVTGLADWLLHVNPLSMTQGNFLNSADEIIFQFYRGRSSLQHRSRYFQTLSKLRRPFKVGVLKSHPLTELEEKTLMANLSFKGTVIFLQR